jgi:hypothetical protein
MWTGIGLGLLGLLIGLDIYLASNGVRGDTWSELLRTWGKATPLIPWAWSVLLGHWFHPDFTRTLFAQPTSVAFLLWFTVVLGIAGVAANTVGTPIPAWTVIIPGIIAGVFLWPVR